MQIPDVPQEALPAPDISRRRLPSVRTLLLCLICACLLPLAIGAAILSQIVLRDGRTELQNSTLQTTRALVQAVDGQLATEQLFAHVLATSDALARRDLPAFHRRAVALLRDGHRVERVILYDPAGRALVDTMHPFGSALPQTHEAGWDQRGFASGRQTVPEVARSALSGRLVAGFAVPVLSGAALRYVVRVEVAAQQLSGILIQQKLPPQWVVTILDQRGTIAARTHAADKYVGAKGTAAFLKLVRDAPEGTPELATLEGIPALAAYSRSAVSGWTVFVGIPRQSLEAGLMEKIRWRRFCIALLFCVCFGLAWFVGGKIDRSAQAVVASARALGEGRPVHPTRMYVREGEHIHRAMLTAGQLLQERLRAVEVAHAAVLVHEADMVQAQRIAKVGGWHWDAATDVTAASPELCRIFGRTDFPLLAQQCDVLFPPGAWSELERQMAQVLNTGIGYDLELPALQANGSRIWINARSEAVRGADGTITGMRGMVQDITERKQAESIAKSERFIKAITNAVPGMVSYWDHRLNCHFANNAYLEWYGKRPEEIIGHSLAALLGATVFARNEAYFAGALAGRKQVFERTLTKPNGDIGHVLVQFIPDVDVYGDVNGFIALVSDVSQLKLAQADLKLADNVYQNTVDGIMVTDAHRLILSVNPAFSHVTGYPAEDVIGQTPALLESHRHERTFHAAVWREITQTGRWEGEVWNRRKDGGTFLAWQTTTRITGSADEPARYVSVFRDITASWTKSERMKHLAFHDALTDLPNRALLMERLEHHITLAARTPRALFVMFLDLDQFKSINDRLGHDAGDDVLMAVAGKLQALVRQADTVARIGGDEFVILLDSAEMAADVANIAQRIIASINEPMSLCSTTARVGTSIGIASFPADGGTAEQLLKNADSAMYAAKAAGKNTYRFA